MLNSENTTKKCYNIIVINCAYHIGRILPYKPIVRSYDRIRHVIVLNLDLVQFYLNIGRIDKLSNFNASGVNWQVILYEHLNLCGV